MNKIIFLSIVFASINIGNIFCAPPTEAQMNEFITSVEDYVTQKTDAVDDLIQFIQKVDGSLKTALTDFAVDEMQEKAEDHDLNFAP